MNQKWDLSSDIRFESKKGRRGGNALGFGGAYLKLNKFIAKPALQIYAGVDGAPVALSTSATYVSSIFEKNASTDTAWDEQTVNSAEFGVVITS